MRKRDRRLSGLGSKDEPSLKFSPKLKVIFMALVLPFFVVCFCQESAWMKSKTRLVQKGMWGGEHIGLWVENNRARLEYDCARGTIDQLMKVDSKGRFNVTGTHIREHGGPSMKGEKPESYPALYTGQVTGRRMVVTITLRDTKQILGPYILTYGKSPILVKCL